MNNITQLSRQFRIIIASLVLLLFTIGSKRIVESCGPTNIYKKDIVSGYLLAQALRAGVDPYQSLPVLAQRWIPNIQYDELPHPTPHTFAIGWLCLPLTVLPYEHAAIAWLFFELICLAVGIYWLIRGLLGQATPRQWLLGLIVALGWSPVLDDLWMGQFNLFLFILWLGVWLALRKQDDLRAGVLLGIMGTFKLVGWPVILWLCLQRRWRGVWAAAGSGIALHLTAIALHGWPLVRDYYFKVGPFVSAYYRPHDTNFSLWSIGTRAFAQAGFNYSAMPPWPSPVLAKILTAAIPFLALVIGLWRAQREPNFDVAFGLLLCLSLIINPIAWTHYLLAAALVLGMLALRLAQLNWPRPWTARFAMLCLLVSCTPTLWVTLVVSLTGQATSTGGLPHVSYWAAWLTMLPAVLVLSLGWLLWRIHQLPTPVK